MSEQPPSRWQRHLTALKISARNQPNQTEQAEIESINLKPLKLPQRQKKMPLLLIPLIPAMAALGIMVINEKPRSPEYVAKGEAQMRIWRLSEKKKSIWDQKSQLQTGDELVIEITSPRVGMAFYQVTDRNGKPLFSEDEIKQDVKQFRSGETKAFSSSIQLSERNDGETLAVFLCPPHHRIKNTDWLNPESLEDCQTWRQRLRE